MGSQQLLLILLGIVIVGIAIAVGFSISAKHTVQSNRDALIADLVDLSANAYQYRSLPTARGGGGGAFTGYTIPSSLRSNENGSYSVVALSAGQLTFHASSAQGFGTVQGTFGSDGRLVGSYTFTGKFQ